MPATITRCHECNLSVALGKLEQGQQAACPRCDYVITRAHRNSPTRMTAFSSTAAAALLFSNLFPFLALNAQGQERSLTLPQSIIALFEQGDWILGAIILVVIVLLPPIFILTLNLLLFEIRSQRVGKHALWLHKLIKWARFWNMAEIYFLGVLVSIIKVISLADVQFGASFWFFAVFSLAQIATLLHFDSYQVGQSIRGLIKQEARRVHHRNRDSWHRSMACLLTGLILFIPANILPIMTVTTLGNPEPNTIVGGVITLWAHGSYPIALVIFVASVFVPIGKFLVLTWLLTCQRYRLLTSPESKMTAYRATEFIGRWSMVDVFVVAFLAGLVQFGNLMAIASGPAVLAFAAMVIATMLSAASLDTAVFWENHERH